MAVRRPPTAAALAIALACGAACSSASSATTTAPTSPSSQPPAGATGCARTSTGLVPLTDLGARTYAGEAGGLYPTGNARPGAHDATGQTLARQIGPVDTEGRPDPGGRYAFVSIGMSNTTQEFSVFKASADADPQKDPRLAIVDGAQGGMTAQAWSSPGCTCWSVLETRLRSAGLTNHQVAAAWVKLANSNPRGDFRREAELMRDQIGGVLRQLRVRFPHLRLAYLSSRTYGGYATTTLNPEPYAYESGFAVKWVIEQQLAGAGGLGLDENGAGDVPWLSWGPYLWADGLTPRSDGLIWTCADFADDGTHPSASGRRKVADLLLQFVRTDRTAREWYLAGQ
ncbi:MAG: hypothetical protein AB1806_11630 [Acidobacteriota bacterium]